MDTLNFEFVGKYTEKFYIKPCYHNIKAYGNKVAEINRVDKELFLTITNIGDKDDCSKICIYSEYHYNCGEILDFSGEYILIQVAYKAVVIFNIHTLKFSCIIFEHDVYLGVIFNDHIYIRVPGNVGDVYKYNLDGSICSNTRVTFIIDNIHSLSDNIYCSYRTPGHFILYDLVDNIVADIGNENHDIQIFGDNRIIYYKENGQYYMNTFDLSNEQPLNFILTNDKFVSEPHEEIEDLVSIYKIYDVNEDRFGITIWVQCDRTSGKPLEFHRYYLSKCNGKSSKFKVEH